MISDDELWEWYLHEQKRLKSRLSVKKYCDMNNFSFGRYSRINFTIHYLTTETKKEYRQKLLAIFEEYRSSGLPMTKFAEIKKINYEDLKNISRHLEIVSRLEKLKQSQNNSIEGGLEMASRDTKGSNPQDTPHFIQLQDAKKSENLHEIIAPKITEPLEMNFGKIKVTLPYDYPLQNITKIIDFLRML